MKESTLSEAAPQAGLSYDETPYPSSSFPQTHPDKLAAMARLFGMEAPAPSSARVLELGCANGANLLPMAQHAPGAQFLGIDASAKQVAAAQAAVAAAGLTNVEVRHLDILEFPPTEGKFDYIIAHGVLSWVPEPVREKIMAICRDHLKENGVAFISYNAFPGWGMRMSLREMMLIHAGGFTNAKDMVRQARALTAFLADSVPTENNPYGLLLKQELEHMKSLSDNYLRHDLLGEVNQPFYFHEFVRRASAAHLQYLGEPELDQMLASNFPQKVQETLAKLGGNIVVREQYMDFVRNRNFRQSLVVLRDVQLNRQISPYTLRGFYFSSALEAPAAAVDLAAGVMHAFKIRGSKALLNLNDSFLKGAFAALAKSGLHRTSFAELLAAARSAGATASAPPDPAKRAEFEEGVLLQNLMQLYTRGVIEVYMEGPRLLREPAEKPLVSPLARYEALNASQLTSRLHHPIHLDLMARQIVAVCDGAHDHAAIVDHLMELTKEGKLRPTENKQVLEDEARIRLVYQERVEMALASLAAHGFFAA